MGDYDYPLVSIVRVHIGLPFWYPCLCGRQFIDR
jgi:hypothetical protein